MFDAPLPSPLRGPLASALAAAAGLAWLGLERLSAPAADGGGGLGLWLVLVVGVAGLSLLVAHRGHGRSALALLVTAIGVAALPSAMVGLPSAAPAVLVGLVLAGGLWRPVQLLVQGLFIVVPVVGGAFVPGALPAGLLLAALQLGLLTWLWARGEEDEAAVVAAVIEECTGPLSGAGVLRGRGHELRTPLNAVVGLADLLAEAARAPSSGLSGEQRRTALQLQGSTAVLARRMESLLSWEPGAVEVVRALPLGASMEADALGLPPGLRVLVVEDEPVNRKVVCAQLSSVGCTCVVASNGEEALRRLDPQVRVVLMDVEMPVLDGPTAARLLRRQGFRGPILALTASAAAEDRERCLESGMDAVLVKPLSRDMLVAELSRWIAEGRVPLESVA
jgi:CheY-like chemotaxis protein